jgi:hypothetical protein
MSIVSFGEIPSVFLKVFCRCPVLTFNSPARSSTDAISISWFLKSLNAFEMISADGSTNFASSGLHRMQARKPARCASSAVTKNETFSRFGRRELHEGLQKIPVVRTPKNMTPSKRPSFSVNASQNLSVAVLIIASLIDKPGQLLSEIRHAINS